MINNSVSSMPDELRSSQEMLRFLVSTNASVYETEEGQNKKDSIILTLNRILVKWAISIGESKQLPFDQIENGGGIVAKVFGSTRLGVHNSDSDIDLLCLTPIFISKTDFFSSFCELLSQHECAENFISVPDAYTPVIKFLFEGLSVDMVFASLQLKSIPKEIDVLETKFLQGLDDQSARSLNGSRVTEWILKLIPNEDTFRDALRVIKYWARQRGLYSNVLGFLGGVNYAILVAFICKLNPTAATVTLVRYFFATFAQWSWPAPIMLREFDDIQLKDSSGRFLPVWNPTVNYKDALHIMPIITPAYPAMNSAYNVSRPQFRAIQNEIHRANAFLINHAPGAKIQWGRLFECSTADFFESFPRYVQVDISANAADEQRLWFGWVESRLRFLIVDLEQPPVIFCHPLANCFHRELRSTEIPTPAAPAPVPGETLSLKDPAKMGNKPSSDTHPPQDVIPAVMETSAIIKSSVVDSTSDNADTTREGSFSSDCAVQTAETSIDCNVNLPAAQNVDEKLSGPAMVETSTTSTTETVFCSPVFPRLSNASDGSPEGSVTFISSFFIGLSFQKELENPVDVAQSIQGFYQKANSWPGKKEGMNLQITALDRKDIPDFVNHTTALPSNPNSCTPKAAQKSDRNSRFYYRVSRRKGDDNSDDDYADYDRLAVGQSNAPSLQQTAYRKNNSSNITSIETRGVIDENSNSNSSNNIISFPAALRSPPRSQRSTPRSSPRSSSGRGSIGSQDARLLDDQGGDDTARVLRWGTDDDSAQTTSSSNDNTNNNMGKNFRTGVTPGGTRQHMPSTMHNNGMYHNSSGSYPSGHFPNDFSGGNNFRRGPGNSFASNQSLGNKDFQNEHQNNSRNSTNNVDNSNYNFPNNSFPQRQQQQQQQQKQQNYRNINNRSNHFQQFGGNMKHGTHYLPSAGVLANFQGSPGGIVPLQRQNYNYSHQQNGLNASSGGGNAANNSNNFRNNYNNNHSNNYKNNIQNSNSGDSSRAHSRANSLSDASTSIGSPNSSNSSIVMSNDSNDRRRNDNNNGVTPGVPVTSNSSPPFINWDGNTNNGGVAPVWQQQNNLHPTTVNNNEIPPGNVMPFPLADQSTGQFVGYGHPQFMTAMQPNGPNPMMFLAAPVFPNAMTSEMQGVNAPDLIARPDTNNVSSSIPLVHTPSHPQFNQQNNHMIRNVPPPPYGYQLQDVRSMNMDNRLTGNMQQAPTNEQMGYANASTASSSASSTGTIEHGTNIIDEPKNMTAHSSSTGRTDGNYNVDMNKMGISSRSNIPKQVNDDIVFGLSSNNKDLNPSYTNNDNHNSLKCASGDAAEIQRQSGGNRQNNWAGNNQHNNRFHQPNTNSKSQQIRPRMQNSRQQWQHQGYSDNGKMAGRGNISNNNNRGKESDEKNWEKGIASVASEEGSVDPHHSNASNKSKGSARGRSQSAGAAGTGSHNNQHHNNNQNHNNRNGGGGGKGGRKGTGHGNGMNSNTNTHTNNNTVVGSINGIASLPNTTLDGAVSIAMERSKKNAALTTDTIKTENNHLKDSSLPTHTQNST